MSLKKIGIGVVGTGMAAKPHALALNDLKDIIEVKGVFSRNEEKRKLFAENYNFATANTIEDISENSEILPGISTYVVNGHTYGQQLVKIHHEDMVLVFCSDLIPLKSHLKVPWIMGYDLNAALTLKEKDIFLNLAAANNWILYFYHDPNVVAVTIKKSNK